MEFQGVSEKNTIKIAGGDEGFNGILEYIFWNGYSQQYGLFLENLIEPPEIYYYTPSIRRLALFSIASHCSQKSDPNCGGKNPCQ